MEAEVDRYQSRVPPMEFREREDGRGATLEVRDTSDLKFRFALGAREEAFADGIVRHIGLVGGQGAEGGTQTMNFLLSAVKEVEPRDAVEGMLAAQMAATHWATMYMAACIMSASNRDQRDSAERTFNKLGRTFTAQVEALKRHRTGGEQKVTVQHQHVNVSDGGRAVVGTVVHGGRGSGGAKK